MSEMLLREMLLVMSLAIFLFGLIWIAVKAITH